MKYSWTNCYHTENDRIVAIAKEILTEYPNLGTDLAKKAAALETPFGSVHEDCERYGEFEHQINRLIDIIIVTEGLANLQIENNKAAKDLLEAYNNWRRNFTYANPEQQPVHLVMQAFYKHKTNNELPLVTYGQAIDTLVKMNKEKDIQKAADGFRETFPELGSIATDVVRYERENNCWLRFIENDIVRLVTVLKLTENREECKKIYDEALKRLDAMYTHWKKTELNGYITQEQKIVIEMMDKLEEHFKDNNKPILTYVELRNGISKAKSAS